MPFIIKQFTGGMDLDAPNEVKRPGDYLEMWNGRFSGPKNNERFETIEGNSILAGQIFLPAGTNKTIGSYEDVPNARIFYFNYNSNGNHGIYIFNSISQIFQTLIVVGVGTDGDILGFTPDVYIDSVGILYGDPQEGDILCFLDSLGRPTKLNIQRYLSVTYSLVYRSYLNVIKAPPAFHPRVVYENDTTVTNNNLFNSLFKFAYTWIYDDNEESVLGSGSVLPLPVHPYTTTATSVPANDARIGIYMNTGHKNVKKINLYMKQTQNGATSDWFLVDTIDKSSGGLADNAIYKYLFYNTGNYVPTDVAFTDQLFDYVPDEAACQCILNGNVLCYGNVVEGYDWFKSVFSFSIIVPPLFTRTSIPGFLFFADWDGTFTGTQKNIKLVVTGAGTNDGSGNPTIVQFSPERMFLYAVSDVSGDISFSYTTPPRTNIVANMLANLQSAAVSAGWSVAAPTDGNSIRIYFPTGNVTVKATSYDTGNDIVESNVLLAEVPRLAHIGASGYSYGVEYFDENGKTNGVITDVTANINTLGSSPIFGTAPVSTISMNLNGIIPPSWAYTYAVVRTDNLTYDKYLNWVSNRVLSGVGQAVLTKYSYFDITNIDVFNEQEQASQPVVTYGYAQGDRVRINALYKTNGSIVYMNYDYAILGLSIDPVISGQQQDGRFLKIAYPDADIAASGGVLAFDGTEEFANFNITIYHNAATNAPQTENSGTDAALGNVYYEIGYKFGIGNRGLSTAYHFGNAGDNQVTIQDGDVFSRTRVVPVSYTYYFNARAVAFSGSAVVAPVDLTPTSPVVSTNYTIASQSLAGIPSPFAPVPLVSSTPIFSNTGIFDYNVRFRGKENISSGFSTWIALFCNMTDADGTTFPYILDHSEGVGDSINVQTISVDFDQIINVPHGGNLWFILFNGEINDGETNTHFSGFRLRVDVTRDITISIYDSSYSDVYNLVTNSDNRPTVEDTEEKRLTYTSMYRWGQEDQLNSSKNNSNRFYFTDFDELAKSYGGLVRMVVTGKLVYMFQEVKCGTVGIFQKFVKTNTGSDQLIVNNTIIEKNNIHYEIYEGGIGNQGGSVVVSNYAHYFVDPSNGYILRWSRDGVVIISILYRVQTWAGRNIPNYLSDYTYQFGGAARIMGAFKIVNDNNSVYMLMAQGGTNASGQSIDGRVIVFDETDNAFEGFQNINADSIITSGNTLYTFYNGLMYVHNNRTNYAQFFGVNYPVSIDIVWNEKEALKKKFLAVSYQSNQVWTCPEIGDITTSDFNPDTGLQQESQLIAQDGERMENVMYFAFLKDANSGLSPAIALLEGDFLLGNWLETKFVYTGGNFAFFHAPYVTYAVSPRNF